MSLLCPGLTSALDACGRVFVGAHHGLWARVEGDGIWCGALQSLWCPLVVVPFTFCLLFL